MTCVVNTPARLTNESAFGSLDPDIYVLADPADPDSPENKLFCSLTIDHNGEREITEDEYGPNYQGISYLGAAGNNSFHIWAIYGLTPGKRYVSPTYATYIGGEHVDLNAYAGCEGAETEDSETQIFNLAPESATWDIVFVPENAFAKIALTDDYVGSEIYLRAF